MVTKIIQESHIVLGIDPGSNIMGYGLIEYSGKTMKLLDFGYINLSKFQDPMDRMSFIFISVTDIINNFQPTILAIEAPFYGKNIQSMLKLGRSQGIAIAAALNMKLKVIEYAPKKIKQSITGNGNSSKEQVALMLQQLLKINELPKKLDATDGLAVAVCHYFQSNSIPTQIQSKKAIKHGSWEGFVKANPERIK